MITDNWTNQPPGASPRFLSSGQPEPGASAVRLIRLVICIAVFSSVGDAPADDWPTYRHDNRRSGVTETNLEFPLSQQWVWRSSEPPQTAWTGPAKWDAYSSNEGLQSMRNFDPCFYVTVSSDTVFFGSSVDDAAHALDINDGAERWVHFTGAAVRMPPTIADGRVLFGSDDGSVYCCDAKTGDLVWQRFAAPDKKRIASNRKIISLWPVRTGVLVDGPKATFAASLVPWEPSVLWTVDTSTGDEIFQRSVDRVTLQGAMLASNDLFYVPQGRAAPLAFRKRDGQARGAIGEAGGVFCILTEDEQLFAGPGTQKGDKDEIRIGTVGSGKSIASFSGTNRILIDQEFAWMSIDGKLKKLDRANYVKGQAVFAKTTEKLAKKTYTAEQLSEFKESGTKQMESSWKWAVDSPAPVEMIKAGNALVLGLSGEVVALNATDGKELWRASVSGSAHGLAVAKDRLFVSTDQGHIYAFGVPK